MLVLIQRCPHHLLVLELRGHKHRDTPLCSRGLKMDVVIWIYKYIIVIITSMSLPWDKPAVSSKRRTQRSWGWVPRAAGSHSATNRTPAARWRLVARNWTCPRRNRTQRYRWRGNDGFRSSSLLLPRRADISYQSQCLKRRKTKGYHVSLQLMKTYVIEEKSEL